MSNSTVNSQLLIDFICCFIPIIALVIGCSIYAYKVHYWTHLNRRGLVNKWQAQVKVPELIIISPSLFKSGALVGNHNGHKVHITATDYKMHMTISPLNNRSNLSLLLKAGGVFSSLTRQFEPQVQVDKNFNRQILVQGNPTQNINNILASDDLRKKLIKLSWQGGFKLEITHQQLTFEQSILPFFIENRNHLQDSLYLLFSLFEAVEQESANAQPLIKLPNI